MVVKALIDHPVADWVYRRANEQLSGRALSCAVSARNHLVRAQRISDEGISRTIAYFCATHATEEAVACVIASAKKHGYKSLAGKVNIRDHAQKAVVASYVQVIADHAEELGFSMALNPNDDHVLIKVKAGEKEAIYPLGLRLLSFNEDDHNPSSDAAHAAFLARFPNVEEMVGYVHKRAGFRDGVLYASDGGAPDLSQEHLNIGLREHTLLTLSMIWAAMDITSHKEPEPFVVQILGAISAVIDVVRPPRVCTHCGH